MGIMINRRLLFDPDEDDDRTENPITKKWKTHKAKETVAENPDIRIKKILGMII